MKHLRGALCADTRLSSHCKLWASGAIITGSSHRKKRVSADTVICSCAQEIQELLESWSDHINTCDRIFIRVPNYSRGIYYGAGRAAALRRSDARLRLIPFSTRRPTLKEAQRVHDLLAAVECYGSCTFPGSVLNAPDDSSLGKQKSMRHASFFSSVALSTQK